MNYDTLLEECLKEDAIRNDWRNRVEKGLRGVRTMRVEISWYGGFSIQDYIIPFQKQEMQQDIEDIKKIKFKNLKVTKTKLPFFPNVIIF